MYVLPRTASFGGTSYQIANIRSVHVVRRKKRNPVAVVVFLLGLGILVAAIVQSRTTGLAEDYFSMAATGISVMIAAFLLQLVWPKRIHVLVLKTAIGEVDALTSGKSQFVANVKEALEQAFLVRAGQPASPAEVGNEAAIRAVLDVAARCARAAMPRRREA